MNAPPTDMLVYAVSLGIEDFDRFNDDAGITNEEWRRILQGWQDSQAYENLNETVCAVIINEMEQYVMEALGIDTDTEDTLR